MYLQHKSLLIRLSIFLFALGISGIAVLQILLTALPIPEGKSFLDLPIHLLPFVFVVFILSIFALGAAYYFLRSPEHSFQWLQRITSQPAWQWGIFFIGVLILISCAGVIVSPHRFGIMNAEIPLLWPSLIWAMIISSVTILILIFSAPGRFLYSFTSLFIFAILIVLSRTIQLFLFPLETYWQSIFICLMIYTLSEAILVQKGYINNFFTAFDQDRMNLRDVLLPALLPITLSLFLYIAGKGLFFFWLPVLWLVCIVQTYLTQFFAGLISQIHRPKRSDLTVGNFIWLIASLLVIWFYYQSLLPLHPYSRQDSMIQSPPETRGVWFTIPIQKSQLYPFGYGRLEDSAFDDMGHPIFAVMGEKLGLVDSCKSPSTVSNNPVNIENGSVIQPRFSYMFDALCAEWAKTLPEFYRRIGIIGILLISILVGVFLLRNPIDLIALSVILLIAWTLLPASRPGQVEALVIGMAPVVFLPVIFRRGKPSTIISWSLLCGLTGSVAGIIRQPSGLALFVTAGLSIVFFGGLVQKRFILVVISLAALVAGNNITPTAINGLLWYRDSRLQIAAPRITLTAHGGGWNPLGGIGGIYNSNDIVYPNALDMTHWDAVIQLSVYNTNPLSISSLKYSSEMQETAFYLLEKYILNHPIEFFKNASQKAFRAMYLILGKYSSWPSVLFLMALLGSMGLLVKNWLAMRTKQFTPFDCRMETIELLFTCLLLGLVAAVPAILTDPAYYQSIDPSAGVLLITTVVALYYVLFYHPTSFSR